jgi:hypothetical protein
MQAVAMKLAGMTYEQIAQALGYQSRQSAWRAVDYELSRQREERVGVMRKQELARYDAMQRAIWERVVSGDLDAIEKALRISDRRVRITPGLEAPRQYSVSEGSEYGPSLGTILQRLAREPGALELAERLGDFVARCMATDSFVSRSDVVEGEVEESETPRLPLPPSNGDGAET